MRSGISAFVLVLAIGSAASADDCFTEYTQRTSAIDAGLRRAIRDVEESRRAMDHGWAPGDGERPSDALIRQLRESATERKAAAHQAYRECLEEALYERTGLEPVRGITQPPEDVRPPTATNLAPHRDLETTGPAEDVLNAVGLTKNVQTRLGDIVGDAVDEAVSDVVDTVFKRRRLGLAANVAGHTSEYVDRAHENVRVLALQRYSRFGEERCRDRLAVRFRVW